MHALPNPTSKEYSEQPRVPNFFIKKRSPRSSEDSQPDPNLSSQPNFQITQSSLVTQHSRPRSPRPQTQPDSFKDPTIYSSAIYNYHNKMSQKVASRVSRLKRKLRDEILEHSASQGSRLYSASKSASKRSRMNAKLVRKLVSNKRQDKKKSDLIPGHFETFRGQKAKQPEIFWTEEKSFAMGGMGTQKRRYEGWRKNGSIEVKKNFTQKRRANRATYRTPSRRIKNHSKSPQKRLGSIKKPQLQTSNVHKKPRTKSKIKNKEKKLRFSKVRKSWTGAKAKNSSYKVAKEYALGRKTSTGIKNFLKGRYRKNRMDSRDRNGSRKKIFDSRVSNETIKQNGFNRKTFKSHTSQSERTNLGMSDEQRQFNLILMQQLQAAQSQNQKYAEMILELQGQIRLLMTQKACSCRISANNQNALLSKKSELFQSEIKDEQDPTSKVLYRSSPYVASKHQSEQANQKSPPVPLSHSLPNYSETDNLREQQMTSEFPVTVLSSPEGASAREQDMFDSGKRSEKKINDPGHIFDTISNAQNLTFQKKKFFKTDSKSKKSKLMNFNIQRRSVGVNGGFDPDSQSTSD